MIKIYDINDKLLMQAEVTSAAKREQEMSKSDYISLSFSAAEKVILPVGAYINYTYKIDKVREVTRKFLLLESYEPTQSDECSWKYTPQFQHPKMILSKTPFFIYTRNSQNIEVKQNVWSFVGTTSVLSGKIADFLNKDLMFGECGWKVIFQKVTANTINVSFSDNDFISALTAITNAIGDNCEWHIDYDDEIIYIGKVLVGATPVVLEVGKNVGVPSINNSKEVYYNAFSIFGGTRNITQVNSKGENVSSGDIRLQLDEGNGTISIDGKERSYSIDKYSTLDLRVDKTKEPLFTKVLNLSQIYPSLNTYVYNVRGRVKYVLDKNNEKIPISYNTDGSVKEYKTFTVWYIRLAYPTTEKVEGKTIINTTIDDGITHYWYDFEVTDNLLINGKNIGCSFEANFNTGALSTPLAGRGTNGDYVGFELTYHKEASSSHTSDDVSKDNFSVLAGDYEIIYQEDNEVIIPTNEAEMLIPRGDSKPSLKCNITVLYNIAMADTIYYEDAQDRLLEKAKEGIVRLLSDLNNYEVKSYSDVFLMDNPQLQIGQSVTYKDGHGYELATRVLKLSTNIDYDFIQSITIGNQAIKGTITQLKEDVQTIIASGGSNGSGGGYSVSQLRSLIAKYGSDNFVSKQFNDTVHGTITFEKVQKLLKGLDIGDNKGAWSADGTLSLFRLLTNNFDSGPYGHGAQIDEKGNIEANSIYARQFISAPKFVFNEISVTKAEQWNTNGYGTIESVDVKNRTITLHLEENDYGSLQVGDICRGLYADIDNIYSSDKTEEGALDDCNFVQHKGFFSTYFYVSHIITSEKGKFVFQYGKRSSVTPDPCAYMDFAQYGSFTDEKRQSSMYFSSRGNSYIEVLDGVSTWEVQSQNRVARYGWLGGLALVKKDGSIVRPEGNGIYVQDNIYFGGNINYLQGLSGLDDLREEAKAYDVSLSQYQSVITVDDMGNVINGLYTEDEEKTTKQYRISTAVFVRKGMDILLEEDGNTEDVTAGHYRVHAVSEDCEVMVQNSTIFVTAIRNIKDGVAGTKDDATFDYDAMRKATDAMVTIVVELEGKTSKMVQMPIRIQHDTLPFMVCDLSNESASVAWNTKTAKYIGLPIKTKVSLLYHNEPWAISSLNISKVAGLKTSMSIEGKAKVITIDADNLTADTLAQVTKMNITVVGRYAGANYEYTRELTILKSSDTVVYELIPSADSIVIDKDGNTTVNSVSCDVYATSSDDKRYKLTALPSGMSLKYGKSENATTSVGIGTDVPVSASDRMVTFALYDSNNNILDKESVPVVAFGKDGKGIEYIFKLQDTAPSNPTPDNYATNTEYQRTDKEFVPSGWTDDPTGVTAANPYEWVCKRVSTNGHWGAFSEPAEYAHFGKHAPKAKSSDDIVTIPTDSDGNALLAFREEVGFSLLVDGHECNISSIQKYSSTLSNVSCSISSNVVTIKCEEGAKLGITSQTVVFKVTGTLDGSTYIDYVTVKVVPNVTGSDGDGYEYIYYLSSSSSASSISTPSRKNGSLTIGWQDDPMAPTVDKQYVYVAYKKGLVGSDGTFSTPKLFNRYPKSISKQETRFYTNSSLTPAPLATTIWNNGSTTMPTDFNDSNPWLWKIIRTTYTDGTTDDVVSCEGYKAKDGHSLLVGYQSSASEPSVLPTPKTLADYDNAQDDIGNGWTKTAPATGGKSIVLGGKITTGEIVDRYNSSTNAWGTEESEILLDGIKQKKTFYKTPASLGNNGYCIRRIKVVNHFRDSYLRVMLKSYSEATYDLVCISRLYLPSEVIDDKGNQLKTDDEYLSKSKYAYEVSGDGQSLVAELSMPDAGEYYFFIGYFKDGSNDSYGDYGLFAWQAMIALTESLWRTDGIVDDASNITWSKAMPMQAEAIVMERAYIATANDTSVPAKPYRTNGILQGGWTAKRLAVSSTNRFIWESVRAGKHGTDSVQDDWSQPVVVANFAEAGKMGKNGCIVRNSEGWKSGATYHNDSALTKEQKYIDLIYIEDNNANDGWSIYQCNVTHTATGSSFDPSAVDSDKNKLWTKLSDAGPMYSPLIVAKNAVLKFAQGQQFNLMEGNNIFGSFRWVKDNGDYAFWIGGTSGAVATTSITRGGKFKTTDADIAGKITASSGQIGGFEIKDKNLVCSNARLAIGYEDQNFTRMVVLDAKSYSYDSYNFALSVVNYGIVTHSSATQAGIHINVGSSNANVQYPGIVMENGTFVGFRVPIVPLSYSLDLRNNASIYASGMCIRCNNSSGITITLPTSTTGAKTGDVFKVIRAGTGDVTIKAPAGVSYRTSNGKTGEFTSTKKNEQIHLIFDGDTWFSECSAG
nr:MAG TPA: tail protein [Caudoviricetes sp.]